MPYLMQYFFRAKGINLGVIVSLAAMLFSKATYALAEDNSGTEFDVTAINSRGFDPKIAELFRLSPRFMPGETNVSLRVNGKERGNIKVRFDDTGQLCADEAFQKKAKLRPLPVFSEKVPCFDLKSAWAQAEINLMPDQARIELVVPESVIASSDSEDSAWEQGGFAAMANYDAQYMDSMGKYAGVSFQQLSSETGFNLNDWIIRSRQTYSRFNSENLMRHEAAYAQRSFIGAKKVLQVGQISLSNSMFGTGQVMGFQVFPEAALTNANQGAGLIEGVTETQSVVEVRQSGILIHSTVVPAGPFRLQGFSLLNNRTDLNVTLSGSNGDKRQFSVPTLLMRGAAVEPGLSYGVGKLSQQGTNESPFVGTIATGWFLNAKNTLNAGAVATVDYRAGAVSLDSQVQDSTLLSLKTTLSHDVRHSERGLSASATLSHSLTERLSVNLSTSQQTLGYRELSESLQAEKQDNRDRNRNEFSIGTGWGDKTVGSLSFAWARTSTFNSDHVNYLRGSWSKYFDNFYLSVNAERNSASKIGPAEDRLYFSVNIPFGSRDISSYINTTSRGTRGGIRYSERIDRDKGWSLYSERDFSNKRTSNTASMDMLTSVSQLNGSISRDSDNLTTWFAKASGGIVAHKNGVTSSPYRISDTFGIAKLGNEAGVRIETPGGPTWTNSKGYAVLPSLNGYKRSSIEVDTRSLAKNVDIDNALQEIEVSRGAVKNINFGVVRTRRVLVDVVDAKGAPLVRGASIFDRLDNFVTVVGEKGQVFIPDATVNTIFSVQVSGSKLCEFTLSLPEKADLSGFYETSSASCY
ncbi:MULTISPECIES: fimbria/pilus outer membrane usher protein [unclassified Serratia (in: enterobacteria)]|uniref:fimbria/pilus outer membrane usher protein n=1 Tax=unclassified Serratia (in: enterobacteria) TaxID=2647522 RepID=UPI000A5CBE35|nr:MULTISPECIES: fimbria/pilus outer membrane usher protein [unclassified Serratia (in: enterobacteria)]